MSPTHNSADRVPAVQGSLDCFVRNFCQKGFVVLEIGRCEMPLTHGFFLTHWQAEKGIAEMKKSVSAEFYGSLEVSEAKLLFNFPNVRDDLLGTAGTSGAAKPSTQSDSGGELGRSLR